LRKLIHFAKTVGNCRMEEVVSHLNLIILYTLYLCLWAVLKKRMVMQFFCCQDTYGADHSCSNIQTH